MDGIKIDFKIKENKMNEKIKLDDVKIVQIISTQDQDGMEIIFGLSDDGKVYASLPEPNYDVNIWVLHTGNMKVSSVELN